MKERDSWFRASKGFPGLLGIVLALGLLLAGPATEAQDIFARCGPDAKDLATVTITDKVKVADLTRFGLNTGMGDSIWFTSGPLKKRVAVNFEGTSYRQCFRGELFEDGYASYDGGMPKDEKEKQRQETGLRKMYVGMTATILSGPTKGQKVKIADIGWRKRIAVYYRPKATYGLFFKFDRKLALPDRIPVREGMTPKELQPIFEKDPLRRVGLMVEHMDLSEGCGHFGNYYPLVTNPKNLPQLIGDDAPAETFGSHSLMLDGSAEPCGIDMYLQNAFDAHVNGSWTVRYWAKAKAGAPKMRFFTIRGVASKMAGMTEPLALPAPTGQWKQYTQNFQIADFPEPKSLAEDPVANVLKARLDVSGGSALLDDIEAWQNGDTNPTLFRDDVVNMLKRFRPGILRALQMGATPSRIR